MFLLVNERDGRTVRAFLPQTNCSIERRVADFLLDHCQDYQHYYTFAETLIDRPFVERVNIADYAIYTFDDCGNDIHNLSVHRNNTLTAKMHAIYTREYDYAHKED